MGGGLPRLLMGLSTALSTNQRAVLAAAKKHWADGTPQHLLPNGAAPLDTPPRAAATSTASCSLTSPLHLALPVRMCAQA